MNYSIPRKYYIYKITRSDGMMYIGTTDSVCIKNRMCRHRSSPRFRGYEFEYEIIAESDTPELFKQEAAYIREYNTLQPYGLNVSIDGKGNHLAPAFTTRGYKFSEESRKKMSEASKKRHRRRGWKHSDAVKQQWSKRRVGKCWKKPALTREQWEQLMILWTEKPICIMTSNGKSISYERAFAKTYAAIFGLTPNGLYNIISGRLKVFKFPGEYPLQDFNAERISTV